MRWVSGGEMDRSNGLLNRFFLISSYSTFATKPPSPTAPHCPYNLVCILNQTPQGQAHLFCRGKHDLYPFPLAVNSGIPVMDTSLQGFHHSHQVPSLLSGRALSSPLVLTDWVLKTKCLNREACLGVLFCFS